MTEDINTADQLLDLHEDSGLSWEEIARALGVSTRQVGRWATGEQVHSTIARDNLARLSAAVRALDAHTPAQVREQITARHGDNPSILDQLRRRNADPDDRLHHIPLLPGS